MQPTIALDRTLVAVNVDGIVHLMLELTAPPAVGVERAPIDAVVVLDRSGSMAGAPIHAVREATCNLLRLLGSEDRLGVVVFDDEAQMVLPLASHEPDAASVRIRAVEAGASTNLSGGWLKGMEMLSGDVRPEALRRIIVLTDGHANAGVTDSLSLCGLMSAARNQGITTSTIGFDDGYDEVLLAALADAGAGNDYWCAGPDQAPQVFAAEFDGLASVVAQNISVEIRPTDAAEVAVLNEYPIVVVDGGFQVSLGDAYGGERRRVVAMYRLNAPGAIGEVDLGELVIRWASMVGDVALRTTTISVKVNATDDPGAPDLAASPVVTEQVNVLKAARSRKAAHESLMRGGIDGARAALRDAVDTLEMIDGEEVQLTQARFDLSELDLGEWNAASTKRLFSTQRTTQKGRRSRFDDPN